MDIEIQIWNRIFSKSVLSINPNECNLVLTESPFNLESIRNDMNEVVFEEFGFSSYLRRIPAWFSAYNFSRTSPEISTSRFQFQPDSSLSNDSSSSCIVIDSGFSYSHVFPFICLKPQSHAVRTTVFSEKTVFIDIHP